MKIEEAFEETMEWMWQQHPEHQDFTNGYCDLFAQQLAKRLGPGSKIQYDGFGHWYVEYQGKFYDANGVLPFEQTNFLLRLNYGNTEAQHCKWSSSNRV